MQFLVIGRMIDAAVAPPRRELAMLKATFELFGRGTDPRIRAVYPNADQRATALVVEVESADELSALLGSLPAYRLSTFEAHPITSPEAVLSLLAGLERSLEDH